MSEFSDRNAYDNALWWYAYGLKSKGDFASATRIYAQIAALQVKSRFSEWSNSERQGIVRLTKLPPFIGVVFRSNAKSDEGLFVARVDAEAPSATLVAVGDRLVRVCGRNVNTIELALQTVSSLESSSSCRVLYLRGRTLVRLIGGLSGDWKADKLELSTDQLRDLAFGAGQF